MTDSNQPKKTHDWERIEYDYRAGLLSIREIAKQNSLSHAAIRKRAARDGWERHPKEKAIPKEPTPLADVDDLSSPGFVYVIYVDTGVERFYKIGLAKHFSSRLSAHQTSSPHEIMIACCFFAPNMRKAERDIHELYSEQCVRGEWYRLSKDDLREISLRSLLV